MIPALAVLVQYVIPHVHQFVSAQMARLAIHLRLVKNHQYPMSYAHQVHVAVMLIVMLLAIVRNVIVVQVILVILIKVAANHHVALVSLILVVQMLNVLLLAMVKAHASVLTVYLEILHQLKAVMVTNVKWMPIAHTIEPVWASSVTILVQVLAVKEQIAACKNIILFALAMLDSLVIQEYVVTH